MVRMEVTISERQARGLKARAAREGVSVSSLVREVIEREVVQEADLLPGEVTAPPVKPSHGMPRPYWERIQAIAAGVPAEEWAKVPADASLNLDHYLHGAPKR
jgi:hypothetical protein